jgi:hypothetical protein
LLEESVRSGVLVIRARNGLGKIVDGACEDGRAREVPLWDVNS